uniref:Uncharacterized protein n=1 Tax=Glossina pallidipes TaxID=7398 RepID=A0A1A9ZNG8_GLOPL
MPQPVAGGYISLEGSRRPSNGQAIYQSTTEPTGPTSMLESMKRVLGQVVGSTTNAVSHDTDDLLNNTNGRQAIIISSSFTPYSDFNVEVSVNKISFAFDQTLPKKHSQASPGTYGGGMFQSNFLVVIYGSSWKGSAQRCVADCNVERHNFGLCPKRKKKTTSMADDAGLQTDVDLLNKLASPCLEDDKIILNNLILFWDKELNARLKYNTLFT